MAQSKNNMITVSGVPEGYEAKILVEALHAGAGPVAMIARDSKRVAALRQSIRFYDPKLEILEFPAWDC